LLSERDEGGKDVVVSYPVLGPAAWAQRHFGKVHLGDKRLNDRAIAVARTMAADPSGSIPRQNRHWKQIKGAYRLFDHERASFESLSEAHWQQTREECVSCGGVVLLIQDTTWLDYSAHARTEGLGWFERSRRSPRGGSGLFLHSVLAVQPHPTGTGRVLGLMHGKLWARSGEPVGQDNPLARSRRRRSDDRESLRWSQAVKTIGEAPRQSRWLHVGDRESDIFELYEQTQKLHGVGFVIRVYRDRNVTLGHNTPDTCNSKDRSSQRRLLEQMRSLASLGQTRLWIEPRAGRKGRFAKLKVAATALTLWSPRLKRVGHALRCWGLRVWEVDAPGGVEPIEWLILTSEPMPSLTEALQVTKYYSMRWLIEQYHQCLKSGCRVQERQLENADRLAPLIGMSCVVAVRLLQLKNDARLTPDEPAIKCVPPGLVQTLSKLTKIDAATMSLRKFIHETARLGGFIGRKSDGEPGWRTLWHGWHKLTLLHTGYQLAADEMRCG
jgi:hypothetical protein